MGISSGLGGYTPPGLVLVKSQTIDSAVSSVTVTDAFSANWDNYLITASGGAGTATTTLALRLGAKTTNYRYQYIYGEWANAALAVGTVTADRFDFVGSASASGLHAAITVIAPNLATATRVVADSSAMGNYSGNMTGYDALTTQYTDFTLLPYSGTITGGTIRVYGYRN
jgi:hypothetical protein